MEEIKRAGVRYGLDVGVEVQRRLERSFIKGNMHGDAFPIRVPPLFRSP